jgi:crotonobetainyl-CoA:carnitine CoA-transferase CaiB-like acyl-CoA transferase
MLLGDMGADIIKIEPPAGDSTRRSMGFRMKGEDSPGFLALNRNKRSIVLDLKDPADRDIFYALVKTADVLVENARPGVSKRLGMDYETLKEVNPRLVYAGISGFGQTGPWALRPGYDLIAQAMSGVISATGHSHGEPVKSGIPLGDLGAGMFAVYGILSALIARDKTGRGQLIDASLFEAALGLSVWETTELWATGKTPQPLGTANRMSAPYQAVMASDGYFVFGAANQKLWLQLLETIGRLDLADHPLFLENKDRVSNHVELIEILKPSFLSKTVDEWVDLLLAVGVPCGPIYDYHDAVNSDHVAARNMVLDIPHPVEGSFKALGFPVKLSDTPQQIRYPPPLLNEHRAEIIAELSAKGLLPADTASVGVSK